MNDETNKNNSNINNNNNNNNSSALVLVDNVRYDKAIIRPLPTKAYYGLEYPANVQNADKAIESVGGLSKISNVIKSREKEYLQLKFRPNNPTCKPTFGTKSPTCHLLLRVRPNKQQTQTQTQTQTQDNNEEMNSPKPTIQSPKTTSRSKQQQQQQQPQENEKFDATIIALVPSTIRFDGLCDFQYLIKSDNNNTKSESDNVNDSSSSSSSKTVPITKQKDQYYVQQYSDNNEIMKDEPMNLIPPLFSRIDFPQNYLFKANPNAQFDKTSKQFVFAKQTTRKATGHAKFNNVIPVAPQELPKVFGVNELMKKTRDILVALFEKRPIWLYISLLDKVQKEGGLVAHTKRVLPSLAFNFVDGPWRKCWVKLGFDPRIHPETSQYQTIDFRISEQDNHYPSNQPSKNNNNNNNNKDSIKNKEKDNSNKEDKEHKEDKEDKQEEDKENNETDNNEKSNKIDEESRDNTKNTDGGEDKNNKNIVEKKNNNEKGDDNNIDDGDEIMKNKEDENGEGNNNNNNNNNNKEGVSEVQKLGRGHKDEKLIIQNGVSGETKINPSRKKLLDINTFEFNSQLPTSSSSLSSSSTQPLLLLKGGSGDDAQDFYQAPVYDYTFKTAPSMLSNLYQIIDIEEPSIAEYWASVKIQSTCQKKFGWFSESSFREGLERMKARFGVMDNKMRFKSRSNTSTATTTSTKSTQPKSTQPKEPKLKSTQPKEPRPKGRPRKYAIKKDKNNNNNVDNNNDDSIDKMDLDDEETTTKSNKQNKEIDESLKNDTLAQMEKDNEYLHGKNEEIEIEIDGGVVGGFDYDDDDDDEDKPFELLDDFDGTDNIQMKQIDDFFGTQTNEDSEEDESDFDEEEEEEEEDFEFEESE
ncbi:transcription factor IIIC-epsilon subunit [Dictyostelium discoideum AX4]|uniref:General transcription factor 3C polypeptide 5 n=1 Tax=Dictyostelium discoideum TaxID=44689 RepID=TF3C5_DICDI|nr:transcription factor IIIC-epsilon subunit [Dictyostelium discoideum AX4]Q54GS8.1 RecName: Full=General transcription factor 3C polypeptide 5; AltName: Full=TF3C-epsilon; AltName: Full=Transcription factor IIIC subunit epsilon [Dictyostelium discoideum]EAL62480.1 transcription factor IIIC-epsilon subunit [Dictyostelium discoideum AX4]|eukprot:XP_635991.1 transcription factor IIIC-epsilon subunit [Dictyostelium discoideum AX4]